MNRPRAPLALLLAALVLQACAWRAPPREPGAAPAGGRPVIVRAPARPGGPPPEAESTPQPAPPTPAAPRAEPPPSAVAEGAAAGPPGPARWTARPWDELPAWSEDALEEAWPALLASCPRRLAAWRAFCRDAAGLGPAPAEAGGLAAWRVQARALIESTLRPWRADPREDEAGVPGGRLTGYYEPLIHARRLPRADHPVPVLRRLPGGAAGRTETVAWLRRRADLHHALLQGSARLLLADELDASGRPATLRIRHAGPGGTMPQPPAASRPAAKATAPILVETVGRGPAGAPRGALGVPLTPGRSLAVDPRVVPLGSPLWLASSLPRPPSRAGRRAPPGLHRLVVAQDTGAAVRGVRRGDLYWGEGPEAGALARRTHAPLQLWLLWPKADEPPQAGPAPARWAGA